MTSGSHFPSHQPSLPPRCLSDDSAVGFPRAPRPPLPPLPATTLGAAALLRCDTPPLAVVSEGAAPEGAAAEGATDGAAEGAAEGAAVAVVRVPAVTWKLGTGSPAVQLRGRGSIMFPVVAPVGPSTAQELRAHTCQNKALYDVQACGPP